MLRFPPILTESSQSSSSNFEPSNDTEVEVRSRLNTTFPANRESLISKARASTASRTSRLPSKTAPRIRMPSGGTTPRNCSRVSTARRKAAPIARRGSANRLSVRCPVPLAVFSSASKSATRPSAICPQAQVSEELQADASTLHAWCKRTEAAGSPDAGVQDPAASISRGHVRLGREVIHLRRPIVSPFWFALRSCRILSRSVEYKRFSLIIFSNLL